MGEFMKVHPEEVSYSEVMFYLEEMMVSELADDIEEEVYIDLKENRRTSKKKLKYVVDRIHELQCEKF